MQEINFRHEEQSDQEQSSDSLNNPESFEGNHSVPEILPAQDSESFFVDMSPEQINNILQELSEDAQTSSNESLEVRAQEEGLVDNKGFFGKIGGYFKKAMLTTALLAVPLAAGCQSESPETIERRAAAVEKLAAANEKLAKSQEELGRSKNEMAKKAQEKKTEDLKSEEKKLKEDLKKVIAEKKKLEKEFSEIQEKFLTERKNRDLTRRGLENILNGKLGELQRELAQAQRDLEILDRDYTETSTAVVGENRTNKLSFANTFQKRRALGNIDAERQKLRGVPPKKDSVGRIIEEGGLGRLQKLDQQIASLDAELRGEVDGRLRSLLLEDKNAQRTFDEAAKPLQEKIQEADESILLLKSKLEQFSDKDKNKRETPVKKQSTQRGGPYGH